MQGKPHVELLCDGPRSSSVILQVTGIPSKMLAMAGPSLHLADIGVPGYVEQHIETMFSGFLGQSTAQSVFHKVAGLWLTH